jgi:hypothetical protein
MIGTKRNLMQTLEIHHSASDPRVKLQAAAIANDCYKEKLMVKSICAKYRGAM